MIKYTREDLVIWVINLDRSPERMARMQNGLDKMGLEYIRFRAFDGESLAPSLLNQVDRSAYERNMGQYLLPGKVGSYYSHLAVWQELANSGKAVGLILEDDVVFHDDFVTALDAALQSGDQWDVLRLNATRAKFPVQRGQAGPWRINGYVGRFTGNGAYLVKATHARKIVPQIGKMRWSFEYEIGRFFEHRYRLAGLEPFPSHIEDFGFSQIVGRNNEKMKKPHYLQRLPHIFSKVACYIRRWRYLNSAGGWPKAKSRVPLS